MAALRRLHTLPNQSCVAYNLGTGTGTSVLEMVAAFEKASGKSIPLNITDRRPGDAAAVWAKTEKASRELNWKAEKSVQDICEDQWRWASMNPNAYE